MKTLKKGWTLLLMGLLIFSLTACGGNQAAAPEKEAEPAQNEVTLTVAAAISMTEAMDECIALYQKENPSVTFETNYAASGDLQVQIEEGAPVDVFISAGKKQMDALSEKQAINEDTRVDLLINKEVLIVPQDSTLEVTELTQLVNNEDMTKLAIGAPDSVPAGRYAKEALEFYNIFEALESQTVYGTNVRQVLDWVANGEADAGIVYATDAMTETDKVRVVFELPAESHAKIVYPAAVINDSKSPEAADAFLTWLQSDEASAVFEKYGFTTATA